MNHETAISRNIRLALNRTGRVRLVDNEVGMEQVTHTRYGLGKGSPDLMGVLRCGRVFCIEVKTPRAYRGPANGLSVDQQAWWRAAPQWGVTGGVADSIERALELLEAAEIVAEAERKGHWGVVDGGGGGAGLKRPPPILPETTGGDPRHPRSQS